MSGYNIICRYKEFKQIIEVWDNEIVILPHYWQKYIDIVKSAAKEYENHDGKEVIITKGDFTVHCNEFD